MKKIMTIVVSLLVAFILFMPKESLYYSLKEALQPEHIEITQEQLFDRWIDLHLKGVSVLYDGIRSLMIADASIRPWLFFNQIVLHRVTPYPAIKKFLPAEAKEATISYTPFWPMRVRIVATGSFGTLKGYFALKERKLHLLLVPTPAFARSSVVRQNFKKTKEGYLYESILR